MRMHEGEGVEQAKLEVTAEAADGDPREGLGDLLVDGCKML
jgi:hypothetical protein